MAKNGLKPEIRFAGFTEDWEQRKLGGVTDRVQGNDGRMGLPTLTISAANGWLDQKDRFYDNIAGNEQKNYTLLKKGQLSYNHGNSKLAKYGVIFELQNYDEALVPRVYHSFKAKENVAPSFIEYLFATKRPDKELGKLISSGARMDGLLNISFDDFMSIEIPVPTIKEQIKISSFFRTLDNLITLHQRKCGKLVNFKNAMLEKMFPKDGADVPEIRFAGFTGAWEQRKLGDVALITMGQSPDGSTYSNTPTGYILVQGNADLKNGWVTPKIWTTQVTKKAYVGDLIMSVRAPAGEMGKTAYNVVIGRGVAAIKGNEFIYQNLVKMNMVGYWKKISCGSTFESLNSDNIKNAKIMIPTLNEQNRIGTFFKNLDNLITFHQQELEKLKNIKKSLLDKMFV
jgi:type I restriction enzyme S subunit